MDDARDPAPDVLPAPARAKGSYPQGRSASAMANGWLQLERTEELMASRRLGVNLTAEVMRVLGVDREYANRLQAGVRARWATHTRSENREQRLERYRHMLEYDREQAHLAGDIKAAIAAARTLIEMEGEPAPAPAMPALGSGDAPAVGVTLVEATREDLAGELRSRRRSAA